MEITFGDTKNRFFDRTKHILETKYGYEIDEKQLKMIVHDVVSYFDGKIMETIIDTYIEVMEG